MAFILYFEIYDKWFHVQLNNLNSAAVAPSLFLERKPTEKFLPMIPVAREAPVQTVAQEN